MAKSPKYELMPFKCASKDLNIEEPEVSKSLSRRTVKAISNAWLQTSFIDDKGNIWVCESDLHTILRTTKGNAKYYAQLIDECDKKYVDQSYIRGYAINKLLNQLYEDKGAGKTGEYLKLSSQYYGQILQSDSAQVIRQQYLESLATMKRSLKKKRIKKYALKYDELTGEILNLKTCEFSHIRSCAIYPQYSDNIENGLIVNKDTHQLITHHEINDEDQLLQLCSIKKWNLDWYERFMNIFGPK